MFSLNLLLRKENFSYEVILIYQKKKLIFFSFKIYFFGTFCNGGSIKAVSLAVVNAKDNYG